jgi:UDP-2,3-diacylglucosamine pyrophosphatase LpxH
MNGRHIIVVSDLHISAAPLEDFDEEIEGHFVRFLESDLAVRLYPVTLVVNGDFLDFVQAPPYVGPALISATDDGIPLCFTESQSCSKLSAIYESHQLTFRAISLFLLAMPEHLLVILPGNHDPDFFWPKVRNDFIRFISEKNPELSDQIVFQLHREYRPPECTEVWIEHGHQYDPINSFFSGSQSRWSEQTPPIFDDGEVKRLYACLGTRFLIECLNDLDAQYPFVDNVKPFSRFLRLFLVSTGSVHFGPLKAAIAAWRVAHYLSQLAIDHPADLLGIQNIEEKGKVDLILRLKTLARQKDVTFALLNEAYPSEWDLGLLLDKPDEQDNILAWLQNNPELIKDNSNAFAGEVLSLDPSDDSYLSLTKGFSLDETALLMNAATKILDPSLDQQATIVVMGHTHERVDREHGLNYLNTGSWTRYYRFDEQTSPSAWSILKEQSYATFPYRLNYVDIDVTRPMLAQLFTYASREHD